MVEQIVKFLLICMEIRLFVIGADDNDDVQRQGVIVPFGDHRPHLSFDSNPRYRAAIRLAHRQSETGITQIGWQRIKGKVLGTKFDAVMDYRVKFPM